MTSMRRWISGCRRSGTEVCERAVLECSRAAAGWSHSATGATGMAVLTAREALAEKRFEGFAPKPNR